MLRFLRSEEMKTTPQKISFEQGGCHRAAATDWLLESLSLWLLYSMLVKCPEVKTTPETSDASDKVSERPEEAMRSNSLTETSVSHN
jgi:hypothetical protein